MRSWIIGSDAACDVVVLQPKVSRRHCRLTDTGDGYTLEDLGSSNGTYVNGERISATACVSIADIITLGATVPMPWPQTTASPNARIIRIGRSADNDIVVDDARMSGHHARLIISGSDTLIEDLGSSNGTFVNSPDRKATSPMPLTETDIVSFGSLAIAASRLLSVKQAPCKEVADAPRTTDPEPIPTPVDSRPGGDARHPMDFTLVAALAQAPIIALVIVLASGRRSAQAITEENLPSVSGAVAAVAFALGLAAIWLGGTVAVWAAVSGRFTPSGGSSSSTRAASLGSNLLVLAALCVVQCFALLLIVHAGSGLKGSWLGMLGILVLASAVGLSLGLFVFSISPKPTWGAGALVLAFAMMVAAGGWFWPLPGANWVLQVSSAIMPARWAFEALLVMDAEARTRPSLPEGPQPAPKDMVEPFFTAKAERMGPEADSLALAAMLISLLTLAAFLCATVRPTLSSIASTA
jgi:pSer/pThr/pTyr-binding forkhead associated (FHA) protein